MEVFQTFDVERGKAFALFDEHDDNKFTLQSSSVDVFVEPNGRARIPIPVGVVLKKNWFATVEASAELKALGLYAVRMVIESHHHHKRNLCLYVYNPNPDIIIVPAHSTVAYLQLCLTPWKAGKMSARELSLYVGK